MRVPAEWFDSPGDIHNGSRRANRRPHVLPEIRNELPAIYTASLRNWPPVRAGISRARPGGDGAFRRVMVRVPPRRTLSRGREALLRPAHESGDVREQDTHPSGDSLEIVGHAVPLHPRSTRRRPAVRQPLDRPLLTSVAARSSRSVLPWSVGEPIEIVPARSTRVTTPPGLQPLSVEPIDFERRPLPASAVSCTTRFRPRDHEAFDSTDSPPWTVTASCPYMNEMPTPSAKDVVVWSDVRYVRENDASEAGCTDLRVTGRRCACSETLVGLRGWSDRRSCTTCRIPGTSSPGQSAAVGASAFSHGRDAHSPFNPRSFDRCLSPSTGTVVTPERSTQMFFRTYRSP